MRLPPGESPAGYPRRAGLAPLMYRTGCAGSDGRAPLLRRGGLLFPSWCYGVLAVQGRRVPCTLAVVDP